MKLKELLQEAGLPLPECERMWEREITGISSDSRTVRHGEVFVALCGLRCDATAFVSEALSKGAAFVIAERPLEGRNTMRVANAREALARLFDAWYGHPTRDITLIGITGTNGKTSTATMLFHILREVGYSVGLIGTIECRCNDEVLTVGRPHRLANMTTPDPAELYLLFDEMRRRGVSYIIMEVTSHALCFQKTAPLFFARAVFTNLTADHLDLHGDMESYFMEKKRLFEHCEEAIVSLFTPYGKRLCEGLDCPFLEISQRTVRNVMKLGSKGVSFTLYHGEEKLPLILPVPGDFSVENAALAAATARSLGVAGERISHALATFGGVRGRMERISPPGVDITVFVDYAHTPDALEKLLQTVRGFATGEERIVLLFGCGGDRDRSKRREMGRIGTRLADFLILTSDNARSEDPDAILADILRGVDKERPFTVIREREAAIRYAIQNARHGDVILLAGKAHEEYEIRRNERLPFSEREIVKAALAERAAGENRADHATD